ISADWSSRPLPVNPATVFGVDIGTTTIAAVKVRQGEVVGRASCFNAQMDYGDNVLTRIGAAAGHLSALQAAVRSSVGGLLSELGSADAARIAVAGNTVMSCLFHGVDPASIGILPFTPPLRVFPPEIWDGLPLLTVPCIAGFVGGDITAGLWETALQEGEMLVDIGTNCEIVFHAPGGILCTAAAAGPAFEGAGLHFGCRAAPGAVEHYRGADDYSVIGGGEAEGLCGSAYIDFLAVERRRGHLNDFGRYEPKAEKMHLNHRVFIHEFDIAQLLKAKAAVRAGIKTIEEYCDCTARKIYLAGGFAQCLDLANAIAIGMLPDRDYSIVGNTSLGGAARLAAAPESMPELERIIDLPREIQLNTLPQFEDNFIDALLLP
ncbi:MAG: ATP-binding protein, partial [Oligosphaeraceae bacterium]|nr:ATP-binding protein [Oligosphaeraceae bacterium]